MYCSSCGVAVIEGLTYCNHCGAKLAGKPANSDRPLDTALESVIWAIVGVFVGGLGVLIGLLAVMKTQLGFDLSLLIFFSLLTFALITAIEAVFVWILVSRNRAANRVPAVEQKQKRTKELEAAPERMLGEPGPIPSVTEQTTRSFEPVYEKRK